MDSALNVLFVCTANICRSAYAEVRARSLLTGSEPGAAAPGLSIASGGTWGWDSHPIDEGMGAVALARGVDPAAFRSRRLATEHVQRADVILTAAREHRAFILEDWPSALSKTFTLGQFAASLDRVDPSLRGRELIAGVRGARLSATPAMDVVDPYRRGASAAAACADHLDDLLSVVVPRLAG